METTKNKSITKTLLIIALLILPLILYANWWEYWEDFAEENGIEYNEYDDVDDFLANASDQAVDDWFNAMDNYDSSGSYEGDGSISYGHDESGNITGDISEVTITWTYNNDNNNNNDLQDDEYWDDEYWDDEYWWYDFDCNDPCYCWNDCGDPEPAPKAKKIFRNSRMKATNWLIIENMIEKMLKDCLGGALYNALVDELDGRTLAIQFGNDSSFDYTNGTVTVDMMAAESNRLFHEMWHAYEAYQETQASFQNSYLNQEIEARYAQYLYLSSLPEYEGSIWEDWYTQDELCRTIAKIEKFVNKKGELQIGKTDGELDIHLINDVRQLLLNKPDYRGELYNFSREGSRNFNNLKNLLINC